MKSPSSRGVLVNTIGFGKHVHWNVKTFSGVFEFSEWSTKAWQPLHFQTNIPNQGRQFSFLWFFIFDNFLSGHLINRFLYTVTWKHKTKLFTIIFFYIESLHTVKYLTWQRFIHQSHNQALRFPSSNIINHMQNWDMSCHTKITSTLWVSFNMWVILIHCWEN